MCFHSFKSLSGPHRTVAADALEGFLAEGFHARGIIFRCTGTGSEETLCPGAFPAGAAAVNEGDHGFSPPSGT